jgi:hypothetical protein
MSHGFTTHIGKIKAHMISKGSEIANTLASALKHGQPLNAIYFKGAKFPLDHWTWPYTTLLDGPIPPNTLTYTKLKADARKHSLASTITPFHLGTKHGNLLAIALRNDEDFSFHGQHASRTSTQLKNKMEFMWGGPKTHLLSWKQTLICPICGRFTSNGHIAGNCPSIFGPIQDRCCNTLQFLLTQLQQINGGRTETITADFKNK